MHVYQMSELISAIQKHNIELGAVLVYVGSLNEMPQTGYLPTEICFLTVTEARSPKSKLWQIEFSFEASLPGLQTATFLLRLSSVYTHPLLSLCVSQSLLLREGTAVRLMKSPL